MNTNLVYDPITKTMKRPISFYTGDVVFENDYYHKDSNWFIDYYKESKILGYILLPEYDYYSINLKEPIDNYVNATPCIFFKRTPKKTPKHEYIFTFDSERNVSQEYLEQYPYVVMMRGCDDGHLGFAASSLEDALQILHTINELDIVYLQDIYHIRKLEYHN